MPFADLPTGARLHYLDTGETDPDAKPPLLLIHGLLDLPERDFALMIAWLEPYYRVIAPTLRGFGESAPKPRTFPPDFYERDAGDMLALLDVLDIHRAIIMGYSDGGEVTLITAGRAPERFRAVIAWGAVGYFGPAMRPAAQRLFPGDWIKDEDVQVHAIPDRRAFILGWINAVKAMIDGGGDVSLKYAPQISCPLLLMLGDQDTLNPEAYGRNFVEQTPRGRLAMFACGHGIHVQAWEQFQQVVVAFLREVASD